MKSGIYKITNLVNGKLYIGSAVKIQRRWIEHRAQLIAGKRHSDQSRAKISIAKLGSIPASRKLTEAQCLEIRALRSTELGVTFYDLPQHQLEAA